MRRRQLKPLPHPTAVSVVSEPGPDHSLPKVAPVQSISRTVEPAALDSATEMPAVAELLADYFRCPRVAEFGSDGRSLAASGIFSIQSERDLFRGDVLQAFLQTRRRRRFTTRASMLLAAGHRPGSVSIPRK